MPQPDLHRLCQKLRYQFKDAGLLKLALTHRSFCARNNERLEFLGDSILSFIVAKLLFNKFPDKSEGQLSRLRAHLVKGETLAILAIELNLGDYLHLGQGELKSGGFRRTSILADALEALIAAIYLDGGLEKSQTFIETIFENHMNQQFFDEIALDAKTRLQEYLQAKKRPLPVYQLIKTEGQDDNQLFHISCSVNGMAAQARGVASTRRKAEQEAAELFLLAIKEKTF